MNRYFQFAKEHREHQHEPRGRFEGFGGPEGFRGGFGCGPHRERGRDDRGSRHGGFGEGRRQWFGRGFGGGGRERLFDAGDLKLVILKLLAEEPSYGYQLMKKMEERLAGGYTPSAGVIYPTLTQLEEEGLASVATSESNKKVYSLTTEGTAYLDANKDRVEALFSRLEEAGRGFERGRSPELRAAFHNLGGAVMARVARGNATPEQIAKIVEAINTAAKAIDGV